MRYRTTGNEAEASGKHPCRSDSCSHTGDELAVDGLEAAAEPGTQTRGLPTGRQRDQQRKQVEKYCTNQEKS